MKENTVLALQSIWAHKMRSILTMLGVIIGIAAIIAIFCIIEGNTENLKRQIVGGSDNALLVEYDLKTNFSQRGAMPTGKEKAPSYLPTYSQEGLSSYQSIPGVERLALVYSFFYKVYYQKSSVMGDIQAITPEFFSIKNYQLIKGRQLTQSDVKLASMVAVLDETSYQQLFQKDDGLGKVIEINGQPFKVVGVVKSIQKDSDYQFSKKIFIPETTKFLVSKMIDPPPSIWVQGENTDQAKEAAKLVAEKMTKELQASDYRFDIRNFSDYEKEMEEMNKSQFFLLAGIASISLLVGGIGVMNIMLVSVTERTREIGVKKALGARRKWILSQFLFESSLLTLIGGTIGVIGGLITGKLVTQSMDFPFIVSTKAIIGSLLFSVLIGIIFGLLPAMKAAKLNPIDALRYE